MKLVAGFLALSLVADAALLSRYLRYRTETDRLRAGMTESQRERADLVIAAERHRVRVEMELARRQARGDRELHLAINVDSGHMILERDGVELRRMPALIGPERIVTGHRDSTIHVATLGERTVVRLIGPNDAWRIPSSAFTDRGAAVPDDRAVRGALGHRALLLSDGIVVYATPDSGLLSDTSTVLEGSVRVPAADLRAVLPNVRPGMSVYFYR